MYVVKLNMYAKKRRMKKMLKMSKKLAYKLMVVVMAISLMLPVNAFASVKTTALDTTVPGKTLAGLHPAQPVSLVIEQSSDDTDEVTFQMKDITAEELKKAVEEKNVEFNLTRNAERVYFDKKIFPYQVEGGKLDSWLCNDNKHKQFEVVDMKADGTTLKITLKSNCYYWNNYGVDRTEAQGADYSAPHDEGGAYFDACGYFDFTASVKGKVSEVVNTKIVPYDSYLNVYELYDEIENFAKMATKNGSYVKKESLGHTSVYGYDMPYLIISDSQDSIDQWLSYREKVENDPDTVIKDIESGKYDNLRVPIILTNGHTNENTGVIGPMNFVRELLTKDTIKVNEIKSLTEMGKKVLKKEMKKRNNAIPEMIKDYASYIGYIRGEDAQDDEGNEYKWAAPIKDFDKIYNQEMQEFKVKDLLKDVIFVVVPTMNNEGFERSMRETTLGIDPNRDQGNQTTNEDANLQAMVTRWNAIVLNELHGRIEGTLIEPCTPPHLPDFEYDLLAKQYLELGEALGNGAIANSPNYQSFEIPARDYLFRDKSSPSKVAWAEPWDDMTTAYGSAFPVLTGTCGITWEQPAYNEENASKSIPSAVFTQGLYVQRNKKELLTNQAKLYSRGVNNINSKADVAPWYPDQYNRAGKQADMMRPEYKGEGQNGNYYPECYIIPVDKANQNNIQAAYDELRYLTRNNVKVNIAKSGFKYMDKEYPAGTLVVSLYQAKRSLVNAELSDGTFLSVWSGLYSESLASRSRSRGYDRLVCAEPAAYKEIIKACDAPITYEDALKLIDSQKAQFDGIENQDVVIENDSTDAVEAVNQLLANGKTVAMITKGEQKGNFLLSYEDFTKEIKDNYLVSATGVEKNTFKAKELKQATVYIIGRNPALKEGFVDTKDIDWDAWNYSYDRFAMNLMGFKVTRNPNKADVIIGSSALSGRDNRAIKAIKKGKPFIAYGYEAIGSILDKKLVKGVKFESCSYGTDALLEVKFPNRTLVNASYVNEGDTVAYEYGTGFFKKVPKSAKILMKNAGKKPYQGCIGLFTPELKNQFKKYTNGVVAFQHKNIALFANSLTHKAHLRDEYNFLSNFIYSKSLTDKTYGEVETENAA